MAHPVGNLLCAFAAQAVVACRSADPLPELAAYDCGAGRRLSDAEVQAHLGGRIDQRH